MDGCRDEPATTWPILVRPCRPAKDLGRLDRLSIAAAECILGEAGIARPIW